MIVRRMVVVALTILGPLAQAAPVQVVEDPAADVPAAYIDVRTIQFDSDTVNLQATLVMESEPLSARRTSWTEYSLTFELTGGAGPAPTVTVRLALELIGDEVWINASAADGSSMAFLAVEGQIEGKRVAWTLDRAELAEEFPGSLDRQQPWTAKAFAARGRAYAEPFAEAVLWTALRIALPLSDRAPDSGTSGSATVGPMQGTTSGAPQGSASPGPSSAATLDEGEQSNPGHSQRDASGEVLPGLLLGLITMTVVAQRSRRGR